MNRHIISLCITSLFFIPVVSQATQSSTESSIKPKKMTIDLHHIKTWNKFTDSLYQIHQQQLKKYKVRTTSVIGGYPSNKDYYTETRYFDKKTNKLLSVIQWEKENKNNIHTIEVYKYDNKGRVIRDYLSAYLPVYRNAPIQTLINIHSYNDKLHSFRQYDASGYLIYEQCEGTFFNDKILLSIDEDEFNSDVIKSEEYLACFNHLPTFVGKYINPLVEEPELIRKNISTTKQHLTQFNDIQNNIKLYSKNIVNDNNTAQNFLLRGDSYLKLNEFFIAVNDYDKAIKLANLDKAYFGRGMAKGRMGQLEDAISDLSIYIQRNPLDTVGYTKRGVRYLWLGNHEKAEQDLTKAIQLEPRNAEAHDDLGVIYASRGDHKTAKAHFISTITLDNSYQKGYHNLAMVHFITGENHHALERINQAITLSPNSRNSLLLKGEILTSLGRDNEATAVNEKAEFLPDGNWSERLSIIN
ncbi:MAG: tetratricopeptide repeat protein [Thiohalomonadales bacterium]